jgi:hypothetical protein
MVASKPPDKNKRINPGATLACKSSRSFIRNSDDVILGGFHGEQRARDRSLGQPVRQAGRPREQRGVTYDTWQHAITADLAVVREAAETSLYGPWLTVQQFLPLLRDSDHPRVVNVSSQAGSLTSMGGGTPAYSASKAALAPGRSRPVLAAHRGFPRTDTVSG